MVAAVGLLPSAAALPGSVGYVSDDEVGRGGKASLLASAEHPTGSGTLYSRRLPPAVAATAPLVAPEPEPDPTPPSVSASASGGRDPALYPFSSEAPWNTALGSSAQYEDESSSRTRSFLGGSPAVNSTRWSFAVYQAQSSDPVVEVRNTKDGRTYTLRIPATAETTAGTDQHMGVISPDGTTAYEFYKMTPVDAGSWTTTRVTQTDLEGQGLAGSRASSTSIFAGLIRTQELNEGHINHTLAVAIPNSMLTSGYVWPAQSEDGDGDSAYSGAVPMGSLVAIPSSVDLSTLGLSAEGMALARALQDYGAYIVLRSSSVALYCELTCDQPKVDQLNDAWQQLYPLMRVVTNNSAAHPGGGGTPRVGSLADLL